MGIAIQPYARIIGTRYNSIVSESYFYPIYSIPSDRLAYPIELVTSDSEYGLWRGDVSYILLLLARVGCPIVLGEISAQKTGGGGQHAVRLTYKIKSD